MAGIPANSDQDQPEDLSGTLAMADAYPMMMQVLNRRLADGETVSGWKIGQTNYQLRAERGEKHPSPHANRHSCS